MTETARNRFETSSLCEQDVSDAIARIAARDPEVAREAGDVYESLTWGEGPGVLSQAGLQHWLWYVVPTKYITDEVGYMGQLAGAAAALLDELGLHAYAAICRSPETAAVHAAFDRSDSEGISALRKAMQRSGIDPPDLADFEWSSVMGPEEASARSAVQDALERVIAAGEFAVGGRGWRSAQGAVATAALDGDHPVLPGQSWRTAVITERLERWIAAVEGRSEQLSAARARVANRLLHRVEPPAGAQESLGPVLWLLERFGDEQTLDSGWLSQAGVRAVRAARPALDVPLRARPAASHRDRRRGAVSPSTVAAARRCIAEAQDDAATDRCRNRDDRGLAQGVGQAHPASRAVGLGWLRR